MRTKRFFTALAFLLAASLGTGVATASADPLVVQFNYTWLGEEANQTDNERLDWTESGSSDFLSADECDLALLYSCDVFPGAAPIVTADATGTFSPGDFAGYNYTVPGGPDVYVKRVDAVGVNVTGPDDMSLETQGPLAFLALWDGNEFVVGDSTAETGSVELHEDGEPGLNQVFFGMVDVGDPFVEDHWGGLASIDVVLGDDEDPIADIDAPAGWVDETPTTIPVHAEDDGLGLVVAIYGASKRNPAHWLDWYFKGSAICTDLLESEGALTEELCPRETPSGFDLPFFPLDLKEGHSNLSFTIADLQENVYEESVPVKIDTQDPTSDLSGTFMTAPGMVLDGPHYALDVDAADGNPSGVQNSGVKKIQVLVDDVEIDSDTQSCPGDNCTMELNTDIEPDNWTNGEHELKVKVTDQVGHVKTTTVEFEVDR